MPKLSLQLARFMIFTLLAPVAAGCSSLAANPVPAAVPAATPLATALPIESTEPTGASFVPPTPSAYPTLPPPPTSTPITPVQSQTLEGLTVGVQPLYADAHRVTFAYSVDGPARPYRYGLSLSPRDGTASSSLAVDGKQLPWLPSGDSLFPPVEAGETLHREGTVAFDGAGLRGVGSPQQVRLSLIIFENTTDFVPLPIPTGTIAATETPTQVAPAPHALPFIFSLMMPFDSRETALHVGQAVTNNGVQMTLDRVEVTASEARFTVRYAVTDHEAFVTQYSSGWDTSGSLRADSGPEVSLEGLSPPFNTSGDGPCFGDDKAGECAYTYHGPSLLGEAPTVYTLTLTAYGPTTDAAVLGPAPVLGTWVFRFTVPAASK